MNLIINIDVRNLGDFITEVAERDIKKVYWRRQQDSALVELTSFSGDYLISGKIILAEVIDLPGYRDNRNNRYSNSGNWHSGGLGEASFSCSSKKVMVDLLRDLGVAPESLKDLRAVKVENMMQLIDASSMEEGGHNEFTVKSKKGDLKKEWPINLLNGYLTTVKMHVEKNHSNMSYSIILPEWRAALNKLVSDTLSILRDNKLDPIEGEVKVVS